MKKINNKGFTLIELLATILIVSLVLGLTTYGIISAVNSSKEKAVTLSLNSVKEAANIYSTEMSEESWKNIEDYEDLYFCVTVEELINKGLLDKNAKNIENNGKRTDYAVVIKNKITRVVKDTKLLTSDNKGEAPYKICTGNIKNEVIYSDTKIDKSTSYTDTIVTEFTDAKFESEVEKRTCEYGKSSTSMTKFFKTDNNECIFDGLEDDTTYYIRICTTSKERGSSSCTNTSETTKKIESPTIENLNLNNSIKITYDDTNIKEGEASYYFMSTSAGSIGGLYIDVNKCISKDNCDSDSYTEIEKDTWYKTSYKEVIINYKDAVDSDIVVTAETRDKTGNSKSNKKEFSLYKITFINAAYINRLNKNTIDVTIDNQNEEIVKTCLADKGGKCEITSPAIAKNCYKTIGWNTVKYATSSSWNEYTKKDVDKTDIYYPILEAERFTLKLKKATGVGNIYYRTNNAKIFSSVNDESITINDIACGSEYYYYGVSSKDYTMNSCTLSDPCSKKITYNTTIILSANKSNTNATKSGKAIIQFSTNGGTVKSSTTSSSGNTYKWKENDDIIYRTNANGNEYTSEFYTINYNAATTSDGLPNYNNSNYLSIFKENYDEAVDGAEWICLSGNCNRDTYDQDEIYTSDNFCDASKGDCTVTLGVNWNNYFGYRCTFKEDKTGNVMYNKDEYGVHPVIENYYYITTCNDSFCNYTQKNTTKENGIYSPRVKLRTDCKDYINDIRCDITDSGILYNITYCEYDTCYYSNKDSEGTVSREKLTNYNCEIPKTCDCGFTIEYYPFYNGSSANNLCSSTSKVCGGEVDEYQECKSAGIEMEFGGKTYIAVQYKHYRLVCENGEV